MGNRMADGRWADPYKEFSAFYDVYVGDYLDDLPFYLEYARGVRTPVLEVGAGSGRLTIPLAEAGVSVVALDVSSSMLAILRSRLAGLPAEVRQRVRAIEADACEMALGMRYDLIMVPFYTFNYFLTPGRQGAALDRFRAHLSTRGRLLIDVFVPLGRIENNPEGPVLRVNTVDTLTGNRVRGWNSYSIDAERQLESRKQVFEVTTPDGRTSNKEFTVQRRHSFRPELEELFDRHGLTVESAYAGYERGPIAENSEQLLYVLRNR